MSGRGKGKGRAASGPNADRVLRCLVAGESTTFKVKAQLNDDIGDLKKLIHQEKDKGILRDVNASDLNLWKVDIDLNDHDEDSLKRLQVNEHDDDVEQLITWQAISIYWPPGAQPAGNKLQIIVRCPVAVSTIDLELEELQRFWQRLWVDQDNLFEERTVVRDSDPIKDVEVPTSFKVLLGLPNVFRFGDVLIRKDYDQALEAIEGYRKTKNAVVVVGHPGIGKTLFLYYLLVLRLFGQQPTVFQYEDAFVVLFDENGASRLSSKSSLSQTPPSKIWALVDSNMSVQTPAHMFLRDGSPFFIVIASSPRSARWDAVQHYKPPIKLWFMEPFTLAELIQARQVQEFQCDEQKLQQFFELYGPSARDCYAYCTDLPGYFTFVGDKIKVMTWATITTALQTGAQTLRLDEGSHKVILISPDPENRESHLPSIITKTVGRMLSEQDTNERWRNAHNLFRTMRLDGKTKSSAGYLLEPPFHALCVKGTTFQLYPMNLKPDGRTCDTFTHSVYKTGQSLILSQLKLVVFDTDHPIESLKPDHYYQPSHGTQPSYDSLIYEPADSRITMFQVTNGKSHPVKPLGITGLLQLTEELQIPTPTLRFVVVIPEGDQVACVLPKERGFSLEMFCLEVTEAELFARSP